MRLAQNDSPSMCRSTRKVDNTRKGSHQKLILGLAFLEKVSHFEFISQSTSVLFMAKRIDTVYRNLVEHRLAEWDIIQDMGACDWFRFLESTIPRDRFRVSIMLNRSTDLERGPCIVFNLGVPLRSLKWCLPRITFWDPQKKLMQHLRCRVNLSMNIFYRSIRRAFPWTRYVAARRQFPSFKRIGSNWTFGRLLCVLRSRGLSWDNHSPF